MLRIGIDARYLASRFSGIGTYSENLVRALARIETEYEFVLFVHSSFDRDLRLPDNWEIVQIDAAPMSFGTFYGEAERKFRAANLDVLHVHYPLMPFRWDGPTVLSVHDLQPFTVPGFTGKRPFPMRWAYDLFYRVAYPSAFDKSEVILVASDATQREMFRLFPDASRRTLVTPYGLDPRYLEEPPTGDQLDNALIKYRLSEGYLLYLGSTRPNKNLPTMLRAFARYRDESGDTARRFVMVLARDRFWKDCERLIDQLGIRDSVRLLDQVNPAEKRCLYYRAGALAFVTKSEGFGFPVLEAQACGCPVITCDEASLPSIAGDAALYADPDDPADIATGFSIVLTDDEVRSRIIEAGHTNCRRYTWEECAEQVYEVFSRLYDPDAYMVTESRDAAAMFYAQTSRVIVE